MRRSLRDAFVGFSLLGGLVIFSGAMLWLKDFRLGSKTWEISASFKDASGLAQMSQSLIEESLLALFKK